MASSTDTRWLFTQEQIDNSPSRRDSIDQDSELQLRQFTAIFINELGNKLKVTQLCINTAIIYMHRFFMIHSMKKFHPNVKHLVAASCLFFSCKVEEHPRPLKQFIDAIQQLLHHKSHDLPQTSEEYRARAEEIIAYESCLIQTLGFNVLIHHAHPIIIKTCQMIKAPRDLAQTAYFTASNSLILTNFCIKYSSDKIACFCIYLACKWTGLKIPPSNEGNEWYQYVNPNINVQLLEDISEEYLNIYNKCPPKIRKKLGFEGKTPDDETKLAGGDAQQAASTSARPHPPASSLKQSNSTTNVNNLTQQQQQQQSLSSSSSTTQIKQEPTSIKSEPHDSTTTTTAKSYKEHLELRTKQHPPPSSQSQQSRPLSQPSSQQQQQQQQKYVQQHPHQKHPMAPTNQPQNRPNPSHKLLNSQNIDSNGTQNIPSSHTGAAINYSQYNIDKRQFAAGHHHNHHMSSSTGIKRSNEEQNLSNSSSNSNNVIQPTPNKMAKYVTPTEKSVS